MNPVALIAVLLFLIVYLVIGFGAAFLYFSDYYRKEKTFSVRLRVLVFTFLWVFFWGLFFITGVDKFWFDPE